MKRNHYKKKDSRITSLSQLEKHRLEIIKKDIPLIKGLHPSFWQNPKFLRWQLVRLNKNYQRDVENRLEKFWLRFEQENRGCEESVRSWRNTIAQYEFSNFYPLPNETFEEWYEKSRSGQEFFEIKTICNPPFEEMTRVAFVPGFDYSARDKEGKKRSITPGDLQLVEPPLIPWVVRFPLPLLLDKLPPCSRKKRGRPQDWALNLLVYELSQNDMEDNAIASLIRKSANELLFGVVKTYTGKSDKDPFLVRINLIKPTVGKAISHAYPFT